ncbi:MAG TPA: hypothetical protein PLH55_04085 [Spirochaetales bacterium]|nr:hypothetical protein [Spirochaetales bacterium]
MKGLRRFLGFALYLCMAFPLMLGGLAVASLAPAAGDSAALKTLVVDPRFSELLRSPDLVTMAPETLRLGGATLDGKAATAAFQASVPTSAVVDAAGGAIDAAYEAFARGDGFFYLDAAPLKAAVRTGAPTFASVYAAKAARPGSSARAAEGSDREGTPIALPPGDAGKAAVEEVLLGAVAAQPDSILVGEAGSRIDLPRPSWSLAASQASLWLLLSGAGLCFASVMVSDGDWRRRLGKLGSRIIAPSAIVLSIGLLPRLILPGQALRLSPDVAASELPALMDYLRFVASRLGAGFLPAGLIGLGVGTAFASVKRALPLPDGDEEDLD